jgi:hypothetical protein
LQTVADGRAHFADEVVDDLVEAGATAGADSGQELMPVAASVFDDDFFRTTYVRSRPGMEQQPTGTAGALQTALSARADAWPSQQPAVRASYKAHEPANDGPEEPDADGPASRDFTFGGYAEPGSGASGYGLAEAEEPAGGARLFAGASASLAGHSESDELDIPAFLRRSR